MVVAAAKVFRDALRSFEPALLSGADCAFVVEELALTEKACAAARARAGARAAECGAHREHGFANPAEWMARTTGSTTGQACTALETATQVEKCPETKAALLAGDLSIAQAGEISRTVIAGNVGDETELVQLARRSNLSAL